MANSLTPENDLQELWEQNGRVKATIQYIKHYDNPERELLLKMLGDTAEGVDIETLEKNFVENMEKYKNKAEGEF